MYTVCSVAEIQYTSSGGAVIRGETALHIQQSDNSGVKAVLQSGHTGIKGPWVLNRQQRGEDAAAGMSRISVDVHSFVATAGSLDFFQCWKL